MANFDVSFLNPKLRKSSSQDYGFLVDQLAVLENQLSGQDGVLSPADYDVLKGEAQKIYSHPGLSSAQRSNLEVKISAYSEAKNIKVFKKGDDLGAIDRDLKNNSVDNSSINGSNPMQFMKAKELSIMANLRQVQTSIDRLEAAGEDSSAHVNKKNILLEDLNNMAQAIEDSTSYADGSQPASNLRAYIKTNTKGQIVDIDISPYGEKSGYIDTNRVYGGLIIAGSPNNKLPNGNVAFALGNERLVASGSSQFDPVTGTFTNNNILKPESEGAGGLTTEAPTYKAVQPGTLPTQKATYPSQFIRPVGSTFIYKMNEDGNFSKYASTTPQSLGITDNDIIPVSSDFEKSNIVPFVKETVMGGPTIAPPAPPLDQSVSMGSVATTSPATVGGGTPRTPGPVERSPSSLGGVASKAIGAAKSFLGGLFGK